MPFGWSSHFERTGWSIDLYETENYLVNGMDARCAYNCQITHDSEGSRNCFRPSCCNFYGMLWPLFCIPFVVWWHIVASLDLLFLPTSAGMKPFFFLVDYTFSNACTIEHWNLKATRRKIFARRSAHRLPLFFIKFLCSHDKSRMLLWIISEPSFTTVRYKCVQITQFYYLRPSIYWHVL